MSSVVQMPTRAPLTNRVAEEVRVLMARRRVTQAALADVLGVNQGQVSKRLRGLIPFDVNEVGMLADYFEVPPAQLLGLDGSATPSPDGGGAATTAGYSQVVLQLAA